MMGPRQVAQGSLLYEFSIEGHVPSDHLLRKIDRYLDLSEIRGFLTPYCSHQGRPSIDPELMIRMLLLTRIDFNLRHIPMRERILCIHGYQTDRISRRWF